MYFFSIYATLTPTHYFVSRGHIFFGWGEILLHKVESLIMILLCVPLVPLIPLSSGGLAILLWRSHIDNCNNNYGANFSRNHYWICRDNHMLLGIVQPEDGVESNSKGLIWPVDFFVWPQRFEILVHNLLPAPVSLHFYLSASIMRTLIFISDTSENWRSHFISLGSLSDSDWSDDNICFSMNSSGVEPITYSIIALYYCWSSHLPADLYNFLVFPRHQCSYKALFINY